MKNDNNEVSLSEYFSLWSHVEDGLIPSFLNVLVNGTYFFDIEKPEVIYSTASVIRVEEI